MPVVRRIYVYLVSAISLVGVTWAVIGLARLIIREGIGSGQVIGLAGWLAVIIVGLPIFLFHWLMANRLAADPAERGAIARKIFLYGVMALGAAPVAANVYRLVDNLFLALLDGRPSTGYPYNLTTGEHLVAIIVWVVVWLYLWRQTRIDRQILAAMPAQTAAPEEPESWLDIIEQDAGGVRRVYLLVFALAGLVMVTWGGLGLLQVLMDQWADPQFWRTPVAHHTAQLVVGAVLWAGHWLLLQRAFFSGRGEEERSVLRKLYLYLAVFVYSVMALSGGATLLKRLLELAMGAPPSPEPLLSQLSIPVPMMLVGGVFWAYHWRVIQKDAALAPDIPRQAGVRRIYSYLVAAIGLAVLLTGVTGLLNILIDILTASRLGLATYREETALFAAMVIVGGPVWLIPWRAAQRIALQSGPEAEGERRSIVRKIYLYLYVFIAAVGVFGSAGWFVFRILTLILGADLPGDFLSQVLRALVIALLSVGVWGYHWWAIREDGRLEQADQARRLKEVRVAVLDGGDGHVGQALVRHVRQTLPGLEPVMVALTETAAQAMSAPLFDDTQADALKGARYILGSWQALTEEPVARLVEDSAAVRLVIPTAQPNWVWAGVKAQPVEYYARQAARNLKQAIEGDSITPTGEFNVASIAAIVIGIWLFLTIISSFLGIIVNMGFD
ncbi:MAG: hypothetical protein D6784_08030 [Chloroflexi bacterium]|nr:MAG: hypothetical protein D6784_08030 [Chloroflexota bacterium]